MKTYKTVTLEEGVWIEHLGYDPSTLTNEQKQLVFSMSEENKAAKSALLKSLRQTQPLDEGCQVKLTEKYETALGNSLQHPDFKLINVSLSFCQEDENCRGVVNYVVGKEHRQVKM